MYGTVWCSDCKRSKKFFGEQRVHYDFIDIDEEPAGLKIVEELNEGKQIIPTIVFDDGSTLVEPSNAELAKKLGLQTKAQNSFYDLIVVGSGPAGLTAALYAAREGFDTLVIERGGVGGQAAVTERLDNFPGFPEGISGDEFADRLQRQAERFGVEILSAQDVTKVDVDEVYRLVQTADGTEYRAFAVLLALGSTYRRLGIEGEADFIGAGVHFCATCDGAFYRDKDVMVVGGGNSAGEESLFLTRFVRKVTIVTRDPQLSASRVIAEKVRAHPQIEIITSSSPSVFKGKDRLETVVVKNVDTGEETEMHPSGVFVFIGLSPNTGFVKDLVQTDEFGFIVAEDNLETSLHGVFAAGDTRCGSTKQAASAAGEGAAVALGIRKYLESHASGMPRREDIEAVAAS
ncbi:MAG: FAD-dependent oxidoreductase [Chloroflexi bacterium]|nr:FAD-dependent oxidoreductase [Chloroflexota bacterium]MCI0820631.1 FAD-dependent oxidoreductase [Chloroflexota bacterium]MCI0832207.1 FAD-dependent oxidoreductase [Chloroflexota bacterium]MCI0839148.1 FAD-dependent oxidoreductase [Chloroflexota bacterium]MCI0843464.1 FAD-dependent oxidoreductase [Chloroflexota bacterium]